MSEFRKHNKTDNILLTNHSLTVWQHCFSRNNFCVINMHQSGSLCMTHKPVRCLPACAFLLSFILFPFSLLQGQERITEATFELAWKGIEYIRISETESFSRLTFAEAVYPFDMNIPAWHRLVKHQGTGTRLETNLQVTETAHLTDNESSLLRNVAGIGDEFRIESEKRIIRKVPYSAIFVIPIRKKADGSFERIVSFRLSHKEVADVSQIPSPSFRTTKSNSVLSTGEWYKLRVSGRGVYRLDYNQLTSMGMTGGNASKIRLFGMGGGMLPERAGDIRPDGLQEVAVQVFDGGDGSIDPGDYILFYGEGSGKWLYDTLQQRFIHRKHLYDDHNYYYLTKGNSAGLRIQPQLPPSGAPTHFVTSFRDYAIYENDSLNLIKSGKLWLGEEFDIRTTYSFSFSFPNIDPGSPVEIQTSFVARSLSASTVTIQSGTHSASAGIFHVSTGYNSQYANQVFKELTFNTSGNAIPVTITYSKPLSSSVGWLDYILVNLRRTLRMSGNQMVFRETGVTGPGNRAQYSLDQSNASTGIWDITNPLIPELVQGNLLGNIYSFISDAEVLREFIAHQGTGYLTADIMGKVTNQDLQGSKQVDMVIISHPEFLTQAKRLAGIHEQHSGLSCLVVTPGMVYNEFSSGKQDPTAIRDFMKMLYDRAVTPDELPGYLLLFGDGSYDNKNRLANNTNFIPTYQSDESLHPAYSYVTDDFYGMLDDHEGLNASGALDLAVGRIPVATAQEAAQMVDKVIRYISDNSDLLATTICAGAGATKPLADWRNTICIVADDEDSNLHIDQAELLTDYCDANHGVYNLNKIYIDAYKQESISGGHRYPDVNDAINKQLEKGSLIINYIGHGGELGWAHERILRIEDILLWSNAYHMPLFLTSTCEFSRFDDPARRSAGEDVYLNPNGGGIAMFTTTRLAFASSNYAFNTAFYKNVFKKQNGLYPRIGDVFMLSKIESGSVSSNRNMVVLGDPALMLAYPKHKVVTTHINDSAISATPDTLKALSKVTVKGIVTDQQDQVLQDFNGILYPVVLDKKTTFTTLANDPLSYAKNFWLQKNSLFKGKVTVSNGHFSFSFIVPKDIAYAYGFGKISYYAENGTEDAHGYYDNIVIGGTSDVSITDNTGPEIRLYLNDSSFVFGGTTDANPVLLALLKDEYGINTSGSGIGHDIVAVLDGNSTKSIILNDYYEADLDSYNSGTVTYGLSNLADGPHHLNLKVWDIFNNSSEAYTEFVVASSDKPILTHVLNYPNPFTTYTEFWFEHNQPCCDLDVRIDVFTVSGKLVKTIQKTVSTIGFRAEPIPWDGLDDYGDRLARGVYVYKVTIRNRELKSTEKFEKLVILR